MRPKFAATLCSLVFGCFIKSDNEIPSSNVSTITLLETYFLSTLGNITFLESLNFYSNIYKFLASNDKSA